MTVSYLLVRFDSSKLNLRCNQASANSRAKYSTVLKLAKWGVDEVVTQLVKWKPRASWCRCIPALSLL